MTHCATYRYSELQGKISSLLNLLVLSDPDIGNQPSLNTGNIQLPHLVWCRWKKLVPSRLLYWQGTETSLGEVALFQVVSLTVYKKTATRERYLSIIHVFSMSQKYQHWKQHPVAEDSLMGSPSLHIKSIKTIWIL